MAEPEITERELLPSDKYIVIASDGIFEFMTNQMVADMVSNHQDLTEACKSVVEEAYSLWLQYEVRTDDITIIIVSVDSHVGKDGLKARRSSFKESAGASVRLSSSNQNLVDMESRPLRREISKERKKNMIYNLLEDDDTTLDMKSLAVPKSKEDRERILSAISDHFLFQHLSTAQRDSVVNVVQPVRVKAGDVVIRQNEQGDKFYIVDSGKFEVRVSTGSTAEKGTVDRFGDVVHVYEAGKDRHPCFGELSLMYGKPRAASVIALQAGQLWSLDRLVFRHEVMRRMNVRQQVLKTIRNVDLLKCLRYNWTPDPRPPYYQHSNSTATLTSIFAQY